MLLLPGAPDVWEGTPIVSEFVPDIGALLEDAAEREDSVRWKRTALRYHRFCRRLARTQTAEELYALILRSLASHVRAEVGALALYHDGAQRLSIVKTLGYPQRARRSSPHRARRRRPRHRVQQRPRGDRRQQRAGSPAPAAVSHGLISRRPAHRSGRTARRRSRSPIAGMASRSRRTISPPCV